MSDSPTMIARAMSIEKGPAISDMVREIFSSSAETFNRKSDSPIPMRRCLRIISDPKLESDACGA